MGVDSGMSKDWKLNTEDGREYITTKVVNQDSLIAHYDASVTPSYKGDNFWYDLSGENNHLQLFQTTYTSDKGGGLSFASGSYAVGVKPFIDQLTRGYTVSAWIRHTGTVDTSRTQRYVTGAPEAFCIRHSTTSAADLMGYSIGTNSTLVAQNFTNQIFTGNYYNVVLAWDATATPDTFSVYNNGVRLGTSAAFLATVLRSTTFLMVSDNGGAEYFEGNMYMMSVYNRCLTQSEIYRNYLSTYDRFI